jgi:tetratricopeptide (TPR) repeat protein
MSSFEPKSDAEYREYVALQLHRHNLVMAGKMKEPEFDVTEERMTELWEKLDSTQRDSVKGMSSDLNWVRRKAAQAPKGRKLEDVSQNDIESLVNAIQNRDWYAVLHFLRLCRPIITVPNLARLRAEAYTHLGFDEYASALYEMGLDFDPMNGSLGVLAIQAIEKTDPARALSRAERILATSIQYAPATIAMSAAMFLRHAESKGFLIDKKRFADIIVDALKRLQLEPVADDSRSWTYQLAGAAFESLGDIPSALRCYDEGLKLAPDNELLLTSKGLVLYGNQTETAVAAFLRAVKDRPSPTVWPYFFLAHYHLLRSEFNEALTFSQWGLTRATTNMVKAELLEFMAISQTELGFDDELVRPMFTQAMALDPGNSRITSNFTVFKEKKAVPKLQSWKIEAERALKTSTRSVLSEMRQSVAV